MAAAQKSEEYGKSPHLEKADFSEAMAHDEHDSSYTKPMELQEEPDSWVLPNVGFVQSTKSQFASIVPC